MSRVPFRHLIVVFLKVTKNLHGRILKNEFKEQNINIVPKSYSFFKRKKKIHITNKCDGPGKWH